MRAAFVTGGSSGIGLAAAKLLAKRGHVVVMFARDAGKLTQAANGVRAETPGAEVHVFSVDVSDKSALAAAVEAAIAKVGAPEIAIASAGIAEPGLFREQSLEAHETQMAVNYFGTLYFLHALRGPMTAAGGGKVGVIASGAAFFGIYGYGAYAPSKFALRGLAEVLRLELEEDGIGLTLSYPPDTDTPQLVAEKRTKPMATQKITEGGGLWSAEAVAASLLDGMDAGRFVDAPGAQMKALNRLTSLIAPLLRWHQARIIRKVNR